MLNFVFLVCRFTRLVAFTMETAISSMSRNAEQSVVLLFDASKQLLLRIYIFDPHNLPSSLVGSVLIRNLLAVFWVLVFLFWIEACRGPGFGHVLCI